MSKFRVYDNLTLKKKIVFLFLFCLVFNGFMYSQQYAIKVEKLNIRENPDKNSKVIGSYYLNDTVTVFSKDGHWLKVKLNNRDGFINENYVTKIIGKEDQHIEKGFKSGFNKVFFKSFIILGIIFLMYNTYKKRIADSRYKSGYREGKISIREYLTYGLYSLIISLVIGLLNGIITWISTFQL